MSAPKPHIKPKADPWRQQMQSQHRDVPPYTRSLAYERCAMTESPKSPQTPDHRAGAALSADETQKQKIQDQLDEALADSFPASDPISIVTSNEEEDWGQPESKS